MYLCCRVKRKEEAGLLYSHIELCIHIGKIRYVRLLFPYPSATPLVHTVTALVSILKCFKVSHFRLVSKCYSHVSYLLTNFLKLQ